MSLTGSTWFPSRVDDSPTSLGSLCHCLTALSENKCFLISNLDFSWHNLRGLPSSYCCYLGGEANPHLSTTSFQDSHGRWVLASSAVLFSAPHWEGEPPSQKAQKAFLMAIWKRNTLLSGTGPRIGFAHSGRVLPR